jgi:hypothetical protein
MYVICDGKRTSQPARWDRIPLWRDEIMVFFMYPQQTEVEMIKRLRLVPVAAALGLLLGCGSPTAPDVPNPDEADENEKEDPKQGSLPAPPYRVLSTPVSLA